ncbi:LuxR C-terminal-related transcriptional regulator [Ekhidna sp.]
MLRLFTTIFLLLTSHWLVSQSFYEIADTLYSQEKYEEALKNIDLSLSENQDEAKSHQLKGNILYRLRKLEDAAQSYLTALSIEEKKEDRDTDFIGSTNFSLGQCYHVLGQFHASIRRYHIGLSYKPSDKIVADLKYNMTSAFARLSQYDSAMVYLESVYLYDLESGDSSAISSDLNSLAFMQSQIGAYEKALDYYKQSMTYLAEDQPLKLAVRFSNIGVMNIRLRQFNEAEENLRESLRRYEELGDSVKVMSQFVNLSSMYKEMGLLPKALDYLKMADKFFTKQENNKWTIIRTKLQLAEAYFKTNRFQQALAETEVMVKLSHEEKLLEELVRALDMRVKIFEAMKETSMAYSTLKEKVFYEDSVKRKEQLSELNELELRFVTEAKEKEIELLELENQLSAESIARKNQQQLVLIIGIVVIVIVGVIFIIIQRKNYRLKEELLSQEIDTLRVKIDSIFGGGVKSLDMTLDDLNKGLFKPLSEREYEILNAAISDKNNGEIAETLFVSVNTVKFHLRNIYEKLGVSNRKEALEFIISKA